MSSCACMDGETTFRDFDIEALGMAELMELDTWRCRRCGVTWIRCLREDEAFGESGRWAMVPLAAGEAIPETAEAALAWLRGQGRALTGGSYFRGRRSWSSPSVVTD